MITELTEKQIQKIPVVKDEWIKHGLSCKPANRRLAEEGAKEAYRLAGLKEPELFVWLESPFQGAIGASILNGITKAGAHTSSLRCASPASHRTSTVGER